MDPDEFFGNAINRLIISIKILYLNVCNTGQASGIYGLLITMKNIAILGSTGSIGTQTLDVVGRFPDMFRIISLVANRNIQLLRDQIKKFQPEFVVVSDEKNAEILSKEVDIEVMAGE